jgi:1-acyl-sn-glycerol-3-phosphate acyltransferase
VIRTFRSALFALVFYSGTSIFVLASLVATLFGTEPVRRLVHSWSRFHEAAARWIVGIRPVVRGHIPPGPHLIAVKHQSMYETMEMVRLADTPVIVLKRELSEIPLFGWATRRYGVIPVDRQAGPKALREMLALGRKAVADSRPVIIFPEGTRVAPGETPPLRPGFAGLYRALGLPVVPVAVDSGRLWGRGLNKKSGTVTFLIGEVIPPGLDRAEIEARVHAAINALERSGP